MYKLKYQSIARAITSVPGEWILLKEFEVTLLTSPQTRRNLIG